MAELPAALKRQKEEADRQVAQAQENAPATPSDPPATPAATPAQQGITLAGPDQSTELAKLREENLRLQSQASSAAGRFDVEMMPMRDELAAVKGQLEPLRQLVETQKTELDQLRQEKEANYSDFLDPDTAAEYGADAFDPRALSAFTDAKLQKKDEEISTLRQQVYDMQSQMNTQMQTVDQIQMADKQDYIRRNVCEDFFEIDNAWGNWLDVPVDGNGTMRRQLVSQAWEQALQGDTSALKQYVDVWRTTHGDESNLQSQVYPGPNGQRQDHIQSDVQIRPDELSQRWDDYRTEVSRGGTYAQTEEGKAEYEFLMNAQRNQPMAQA